VSIVQHIVTLEALVDCDASIKSAAARLAEARAQIDGLRTEREGLQERVDADTASVNEMEKTRSELIQELRQMENQISRSRERLGRSRNEREVNAAERELDELRKLQRDRDGEVKKLVTLCDEAGETIEANETRCTELSAQLEGSLEGVTQTINQSEAELGEHNARRTGITEKLPSLTYRRYQSMHERGKTPVAKTNDGTCQGCYVAIPPMVYHQMLSQRRFEECSSCHRILYYVAPEPEKAEEANESDAVDAEVAVAESAAKTEEKGAVEAPADQG
jgi:hypothetical protein